MTLADQIRKQPFTLAFSSAFFGFFAHIGILRAFEEQNLQPQKVTGASAGAIIAAGIASGLNSKDLEKLCVSLKLQDFWDPALGLGFVKGAKIEKIFQASFVSDFSHGKIPVRISTFDILSRKTISFTTGDLIAPLRASIAVPLMFHPVKIAQRYYWDGGILDKMGVEGLDENETIVSAFVTSSRIVDALEFRPRTPFKNLRKIILNDLPNVGPKYLHNGPSALEAAYQFTRKALQENIS